jgi:outer membrane protein TolC
MEKKGDRILVFWGEIGRIGFLAALLLLAVAFSATAQQSYSLTLEESIEIAKEKSLSMLTLREELKMAEYNLKSATSTLKTHVTMNLTLPNFSNTIREKSDSTGIFFPVKELTWSGGLTITQPLPTDGSIYIQNGLSSFKNYYSGAYSGNLSSRLGFSQPLDAFYGYSQINTRLREARLEYDRTNKRLKRTELSLVTQVSRVFYNLLYQQKNAEITLLDLNRQDEASKISKNKFAAGLIREVDDLQMEVDLAQAQSAYDLALLEVEQAGIALKELLGISLSDSVTLRSEMKYKPVFVDVEKAVAMALENRLEIKESLIDAEQQQINIKRQKIQGRIRGNINGYFERVGIAEPYSVASFPSTVSTAYDDFLNRPFSYGIGLTISVPIFDWGENRALVKAAEVRLKEMSYQRQQTERGIERDVRNSAKSIGINLKRLQLLEKNVEVAEKSFAITLQRFSDGDIDSQTLALERNRLNGAYNSHLNAYIQYQLSLAELMEQTYFDYINETGVE